MAKKSGTWNYRVVRHTYNNETFYHFHEARYKADVEILADISKDPAYPHGETVEELEADLDRFREALAKPVLEYKDYWSHGDDDIADLDLPSRTVQALRGAGVHTINQLTKMTWLELLATKGSGKKALKDIVEALSERGLSLAPGRPMPSLE